MSTTRLLDINGYPKAWVKWTHDWGTREDDPMKPVRMVGAIRFYREDGLDPRVHPEPNGTHLSRCSPGNMMHTHDNRIESSCGVIKKGFSDYAPITAITCPDCAAMLAAMLLKEEL